MKKDSNLLKSIGLGLAILVILTVYAYGFQVTKVNFEKTRSENRLTQLTRIIRALAHPDIFEYDQIEEDYDAPVYLPCPEGEIVPHEPDKSEPYLELNPVCAGPGEFIEVNGYNFNPDIKGPINFIPPSGAVLTIGTFQTDSDGTFQQRVKLPKRQPVDDAQIIRATARRNVGTPYFSKTAKSTWDKIIETVFLALLATTLGTFLAIPTSFLAARNLMSDIKSPLSSIALSILGWPIGIVFGLKIVEWVQLPLATLTTSLGLNTTSLVIGLGITWGAIKLAIPPEDSLPAGNLLRIGRFISMVVSALSMILTAYLLANFMFTVGETLTASLGAFSFIGNFISQLGDVLRMITPMITALGLGGAVGNLLGKTGLMIAERTHTNLVKLLNILFTTLALASLFAIIGGMIDWIYQFNNPMKTLWGPAAAGALLGIMISLKAGATEPVSIGSVIYYITRTILNATRSVEPLVMVIIFVVWVGIGPFAGALALALHTIAALAKLYSEQVESILPGPLEAVTATGANRLQTIVYAVVPQIIPPYISFTMYRWDINVRMSTIIGFAGGGGIGFLLQQNINLLNYRGASVQMVAIAVVVASMDYISSIIRERFV